MPVTENLLQLSVVLIVNNPSFSAARSQYFYKNNELKKSDMVAAD